MLKFKTMFYLILEKISLSELKISFHKKFLISFFNQGIFSGTSLVINVSFAYLLSLSDYGYYTLSTYSAVMTAGAFNAIFLNQAVVSVAKLQTGLLYKKAFLLCTLLLFSLLLLTLLVLLTCLFSLSTQQFFSGASIVLLQVGLALRDINLRLHYATNELVTITKVNIVFSFIMITLLGFLMITSLSLSAQQVILFTALVHIISNIGPAVKDTKLRTLARFLSYSRAFIKKSIMIGVNNFLSFLIFSMRSRAVSFISGFTLGPEAVGILAIAQLFVSPVSMLTPALNGILIPIFSRKRDSFKHYVLRFSKIFFLFSAAYAATVYTLIKSDFFDVFNFELKAYETCIILALITTIILSVKNPLEMGLLSKQQYFVLRDANITTALIVLIIAWPVVTSFDVVGAGLVLTFSELIFFIALSKGFNKFNA